MDLFKNPIIDNKRSFFKNINVIIPASPWRKKEQINNIKDEKGNVTANPTNITNMMRAFKQLFTNAFENSEGMKRILRKTKHVKTDTRKNRKSE